MPLTRSVNALTWVDRHPVSRSLHPSVCTSVPAQTQPLGSMGICLLTRSRSLIENSGGAVPRLGSAPLHNGPQGAVRVQRKPVHINGHLQRVPAHLLPQRFHVSGLCVWAGVSHSEKSVRRPAPTAKRLIVALGRDLQGPLKTDVSYRYYYMVPLLLRSIYTATSKHAIRVNSGRGRWQMEFHCTSAEVMLRILWLTNSTALASRNTWRKRPTLVVLAAFLKHSPICMTKSVVWVVVWWVTWWVCWQWYLEPWQWETIKQAPLWKFYCTISIRLCVLCAWPHNLTFKLAHARMGAIIIFIPLGSTMFAARCG